MIATKSMKVMSFSLRYHNPVGALEEQSWVELYNTTSKINLKDFVPSTDTEAEGYIVVNDIYLFLRLCVVVANTDELTNRY